MLLLMGSPSVDTYSFAYANAGGLGSAAGYRGAPWGVVQWHDAGFWCREIQVRILAPQSDLTLGAPTVEDSSEIGDHHQGLTEDLAGRVTDRQPAEPGQAGLAVAVLFLPISGPVPS